MTQGTVTKVVHLANQPDLPGADVSSQHNSTGYGYLESPAGDSIYFDHSVVTGRPFKHLEEGQHVEFEMDAEQKKAISVQVRE